MAVTVISTYQNSELKTPMKVNPVGDMLGLNMNSPYLHFSISSVKLMAELLRNE